MKFPHPACTVPVHYTCLKEWVSLLSVDILSMPGVTTYCTKDYPLHIGECKMNLNGSNGLSDPNRKGLHILRCLWDRWSSLSRCRDNVDRSRRGNGGSCRRGIEWFAVTFLLRLSGDSRVLTVSVRLIAHKIISPRGGAGPCAMHERKVRIRNSSLNTSTIGHDTYQLASSPRFFLRRSTTHFTLIEATTTTTMIMMTKMTMTVKRPREM